MKSSKGFTLLEIMLVLMVIAISATIVTMSMGSSKGSQGSAARMGEQLSTVIDYVSDWSTMQGKPVGLQITENTWQLFEWKKTGQKKYQWQPLETTSRIPLKGLWEKTWKIVLTPQGLSKAKNREPQIMIMPDGEITPFTLQVIDSQSRDVFFTLKSDGLLPVTSTPGDVKK